MSSIKEILKKMEEKRIQKLLEEALLEQEKIDIYEKQRLSMIDKWKSYENFNNNNPIILSYSSGGHEQSSFSFGGSLEFGYQDGDLRYLTVSASTDFNIGSNDFTIEWFQYQVFGSDYPRVFQFDSWPSPFGVSVESAEDGFYLYFWVSVGSEYIQVPISNILNKWSYFAISRVSGTTRIYLDGQLIKEDTGVYSIDVTGIDLSIGIDPGYLDTTYFSGGLTNLRIINGTGLYSTPTITIPTSKLQKVENTILLLNVADEASFITDSSDTGKILNNTGQSPVIWNPSNPSGGFTSIIQ